MYINIMPKEFKLLNKLFMRSISWQAIFTAVPVKFFDM